MFVVENMKGMQEVTEEEIAKVFEKYYGGVFSLTAIVENMKLGVKYDLGNRKYAWCELLPGKPMDGLTKTAIDLASSLGSLFHTLPKECQDAYEAFQKAYVAEIGKKIPAVPVNVEVPLLHDFTEDISKFREGLEKTLDELGDLLDSFNTKYGELLKLSVEMNFKVEEV